MALCYLCLGIYGILQMSLRRYLLICYFISVGLLFVGLVGLATSMGDQPKPLGSLMAAAFVAIFNVFVNIWPWARRVPEERRTGFGAYRVTNVFLGIVGAVILISSTAILLDL